jgi:hypothetical protein
MTSTYQKQEGCNSGIHPNNKIIISSSYTSLQAKMAKLGNQIKVVFRKGFLYHSVEQVLPASSNRHEVESNTIFLSD